MNNVKTKQLNTMMLDDEVVTGLADSISVSTISANNINVFAIDADSISVSAISVQSADVITCMIGGMTVSSANITDITATDVTVANDISVDFDGQLSSVKEFMLKKPDSTIKFASPNTVENQAIAEAIQRQKYDIMIAQESVNQVARRVKVLEDAAQVIITGDYDLSVGTPEELSAFALSVQSGIDFNGKTVVLARNIDLQDYADFPTIGKIGDDSKQFAGTFDGQQHCILNFTFKSDDALTCVGLFPKPKQANKSKIINLNLINFNINVPNSSAVGCVAGQVFEYSESHDYCIFENITASGTIVALNTYGGLVGNIRGVIHNCSFTGFLSGGNRVVGGLVGKFLGDPGSGITKCKANGMIDVFKPGTGTVCAGGIIGSNPGVYTNDIKECYSNMLIRYDDGQTRTTVDYLPIIGAMPKTMADADYETLKEHVKDNSWNTGIYTAEKFYLYDSDGNDFDKKYELPN